MSARRSTADRGLPWPLLAAVISGLVAAGGTASAQPAGPLAYLDANGAAAGFPSPGAQFDVTLAPAFAALAADAPDSLTEHVHIPGSAFVPMHSDSGVEYAPWGCMYMTGPSGASNFAVQVPSGSTVTYLRLYYKDTSATYNGVMQFAQYDDGAGGAYLETLATSGSGGFGTVTLSGLSLPIDYVNHSYVLYWDVDAAAGSQLQLCGFRVGYIQPRIFVDGFESGNTAAWSSTVP